MQVLRNLTGEGRRGRFADAGAAVGANAVPRSNGRGLAAADYDNDGDVDVAINSIGGKLDPAPQQRRSRPLARGRSSPALHPGTRVTAVLPGGRRLVREVQAGSSYLSSGGSARPLRARRREDSPRARSVRAPNGRETRLANVAADRLVTVTP